MKHFNDYPIYFLAPSKTNGAVASFGHSHVDIQPEEINVGLDSQQRRKSLKQKFESLGVKSFQKVQSQTNSKYSVLSLPNIRLPLGNFETNQ